MSKESKLDELIESLVADIKQIEDFEDRLYTILVIKYILDNKGEGLYGKIVVPLMGGRTCDPSIERKTIKIESHFRYLLEGIYGS